MDEEPLTGGNMNAVVRVGATVRRAAGPWTPTVHRLLDHLRAHGFDAAPRALGLDAQGREMLSFLAGDVPVYPLPRWVWAEAVLRDAGRLLRRWHDASVDFDRSGAVWQLPGHDPAEVICHNDFSPHNLVFRDGRPTGVIDVDMASPGPRAWDLAYLATRLLPLSRDHEPAWTTPGEAAARLHMLLEAYGTEDDLTVLDLAQTRLLDLADFSDRKAEELGRPDLHEHAAAYRADEAWLRTELRPLPARAARLRPMTDEEYTAWQRTAVQDYAAELAESGSVDTAGAERRAAEQYAELLPDGRHTPGAHLFSVLDEAGTAVGVLWLGQHPQRAGAGYVYDIVIDEDRRGQGLGRAAMLAAEEVGRGLGWTDLGLNVFGPNATARALYDSLGYTVVRTAMTKPL